MNLESISYSEFLGTEKDWKLEKCDFTNINLLVGKNATGKSRTLSVIAGLANLFSGKQKQVFESGEYNVVLEIDNDRYVYDVSFSNYSVVSEKLSVNNVEKMSRNTDGKSYIHYEDEQVDLNFNVPSNVLAAVQRQDALQHPFLLKLAEWANQVRYHAFGTDFGRLNVLTVGQAQALSDQMLSGVEIGGQVITPPSNEVPEFPITEYIRGFSKYKEEFDLAVIEDMGRLGYELEDIGSAPVITLPGSPSLMGLFVVEKDVGLIPQTGMSQGMFRALALIIHLNIAIFSRKKQTILIDDIGEGLDFDRATAMINLLIEKSLNKQLLMSTNDRFVMNNVPLEYWMILRRSGRRVKTFTARNTPEAFANFKFMGLNNFDLFASNLFE